MLHKMGIAQLQGHLDVARPTSSAPHPALVGGKPSISEAPNSLRATVNLNLRIYYTSFHFISFHFISFQSKDLVSASMGSNLPCTFNVTERTSSSCLRIC